MLSLYEKVLLPVSSEPPSFGLNNDAIGEYKIWGIGVDLGWLDVLDHKLFVSEVGTTRTAKFISYTFLKT